MLDAFLEHGSGGVVGCRDVRCTWRGNACALQLGRGCCKCSDGIAVLIHIHVDPFLVSHHLVGLFKVIFSLETEGDVLPRLVQFLRVVDKYVHRPVSCHNDCQEAVKMCYAYKANAFPRKNVLSGTQKR